MLEKLSRSEFYEKYGKIEVKFSSYYKYTFSYQAELPSGHILSCEYGGHPDSIYRFSVDENPVLVETLEPCSAYVVNENGDTIAEYNSEY